jgi:hypothetical protein
MVDVDELPPDFSAGSFEVEPADFATCTIMPNTLFSSRPIALDAIHDYCNSATLCVFLVFGSRYG